MIGLMLAFPHGYARAQVQVQWEATSQSMHEYVTAGMTVFRFERSSSAPLHSHDVYWLQGRFQGVNRVVKCTEINAFDREPTGIDRRSSISPEPRQTLGTLQCFELVPPRPTSPPRNR